MTLAQGKDCDKLIVDAVNWMVGTQMMAASNEAPGVESISYHYPLGPGDKHYVDIYMEKGTVSRIFNPTQIVFKDTDYEAGSYDTERVDGSEDQDAGAAPVETSGE